MDRAFGPVARSLVFAAALAAFAGPEAFPDEPLREGPKVQKRAVGTFEVTRTPRESDETPEGIALGRSALEKRFHGDLEGTGKGSMLTAVTTVEGSAGYVAIERVTGELHGRSGSFLLQHHGLMSRGAQDLSIVVIPDSGTGGLEGLEGAMSITIADGTHSYEMIYSLPDDGLSSTGVEEEIRRADQAGVQAILGADPPERRRYTHVWVEREGAWQLVARHSGPIRDGG
jgi:hypothetical protein